MTPLVQLTASALLALWETAGNQLQFVRAITLVALLIPKPIEDLMRLSLGQRNLALLRLREHLFGCNIISATSCSNCQESVEMQLNVESLYCQFDYDEAIVKKEFVFHVADYQGTFRVLTSADLESIVTINDEQLARQQLVQRCMLSLDHYGEPEATTQLSDEVVEGLEQALSEADPLAEIHLKLTCPTCQHCWMAELDIAGFLWEELEQRALSLLVEIHWLAWAYGWNETDILALSDMRRRYYLEMIRG